MTESVLLCGVGSQGTILVSYLITLATMEKGMEAKRAKTIGMAQGGENMVSHMHISEEIHSPLIPHGEASVLIGFEPTGTIRCLLCLKKSDCVVVPPAPMQSVTISLTGGGYVGLEIVECPRHAVSNLTVVDAASIGMAYDSPKAMNVALLGAVVTDGLIGISLEEVKTAIGKRVSEKPKDMNMEALKLGVPTNPTIR